MRIYHSDTYPMHVVVEADDGWWLVATVAAGWRQRTPWRAPQVGLRPLLGEPAASRLLASLWGLDPDRVDPLVALADAARELGVDPSALRHALRDGRIAGTRFGRDWYIATSALARYATERRTWRGKHAQAT